jgi:nicotinamide riboside kinase
MIISFTGAQSTGKTTLLEACKQKYTNFTFVDEVTRKVKREFGVHINELGGNETQLLILAEHIRNHMLQGNVILDRCIVDGYVYTEYLNEKGKVHDVIVKMFNDVLPFLYDRIDIIFYTDPSDVKLIDDGVRSIDIEFRNNIIYKFEQFIKSKDTANESKIIRLKRTVEERLQTIEKYIK